MITILRGAPGSGKSTWAKAQFGHSVVSADDYMVNEKGEYEFRVDRLKYCHTECFIQVAKCVEADVDVIVDNTNSTLWEMAPYRMLAHVHGVELKVIEFHAKFKNVHGVPQDRVDAFKLEPIPDWWLL